MVSISDKELMRFAKWYKHYFGKHEVPTTVFITCLCGTFHSYPKAMKESVKRMQTIGLIIENEKNIIKLL